MHLPLVTKAGFGPFWLRRYRTRLWDTLRMTTAVAVTFALGVALGLSQSFWAVIAAVVATQSSLGGTLKASFEQFIGSVFGAVWGAAITLAIPHQTPWMLGLTLIIAVAPLAWLTTFSPGFRIAPITAILVLLSSVGITLGPVGFAVERLLEIGLGCAVGLGVSALVVPAHAYDAARERRSRLVGEPDPEPLSRTLARLQTDVSAFGRILTEPLPEAAHAHLSEPWSNVARAAASALRHASLTLPARGAAPALDPVIDAIAAYE